MSVKIIKRSVPPYAFESYAHLITPLSIEDGGGFLFSIPDLPGCIADGNTLNEAIINGRDAFYSWVSACSDRDQEVPAPKYKPHFEYVSNELKIVNGVVRRREDEVAIYPLKA